MCNRPFQQLWYRAARLAAAQPQGVMSDAEYSRDGLRAAGVAGSICSVLHGPDGSQTQQEVVAGDQRQIHDLSRSREKPVSRVAERQWQLLSGQHDLVGERRFPQRRGGLRQPLCQIEGRRILALALSNDPCAIRIGLPVAIDQS